MGSATRDALTQCKEALAALGSRADLATGEDMLAASRVIGRSVSLRSAVADPSADTSSKRRLINRVFASTLNASAVELLETVASQRWSSGSDALAGIEELGLRAIAASAGPDADIEGELFAFARLVASHTELELALGSSLGAPEVKLALVDRLVAEKVARQTLVILQHLVQQPHGRRLGELLAHAASVVADQSGLGVATVFAASPMAPPQRERLRNGLARVYGRDMFLNEVVDSTLMGGLRVRIGDDVIDGSVASHLNQLRLRLAS
jgi:F-type H+-transporting ATPase subunit delta